MTPAERANVEARVHADIVARQSARAKLIADAMRELRSRGLAAVAYNIERANDDGEIGSIADLRREVGRWAECLTPETRAALEGSAR